jgi:hypothetical protein
MYWASSVAQWIFSGLRLFDGKSQLKKAKSHRRTRQDGIHWFRNL